jgi:inner membrane protein
VPYQVAMDSITHVVLGAAIGEVLLGRKLKKQALIYGAVAQSLPDIDFVAALWMSPSENLLAHRGITHSILFVVVAGLVLAWAAHRWHRENTIPFSGWAFFFSLQLLIHLSIDTFNAYGVGWLEPFIDDKFSVHTLYVADPFYSLALGIAFPFLLGLANQKSRARIARYALLVSSLYLVYAGVNKLLVEQKVKRQLSDQGNSMNKYFTTPAPFNTWLWFVVVSDGTGYQVGYCSVFDGDKSLTLTRVEKRKELARMVKAKETFTHLEKFSQGWYTLEQRGDTLIFNIPRFGQVTGWDNGSLPFVFRYYLDLADEENKLVMQRGRFENWNNKTRASLMRRIQGD